MLGRMLIQLGAIVPNELTRARRSSRSVICSRLNVEQHRLSSRRMQREFIPSVPRVSNAILGEIKASISQPRTVTDEQLASLHLLHDKVLGRALQIVDQGHVKCFVAEHSQRRLFVVQGKTAADQYLVLPDSYCSCKAFLFDVVGRGEGAYILCMTQCKHQLAAQLADALQMCAVITISDAGLTAMLLTA